MAGIRRAAGALLVAAVSLLAACGTLPSNIGKVDTLSLAPDPQAPLVQIAARSIPAPDQSGVRLLPLGAFSLDTRVQLATRAARSLDVQYYQFENDGTGRLLMVALRDAAARGVRVRLLVDDLYTTHTDALLRGLASFPNVEVRLFNPFCCARGAGVAGRYAASIGDFTRLNHRMHNKLFVADGSMAVIGGRNIADEYFLRSEAANFVDMDAFVMGAVVRDLASIFDKYWNSEVVYPIEAIGDPIGDRAERRKAFDDTMAHSVMGAPVDVQSTDVLGYGPLAEEFDAGQVGLQWGKARAFADPPEKLLSKSPKIAYETSVTNNVMMAVWEAKSELVVTSPYMIPGAYGLESFRRLQDAKVKVTVVTNSLAATDEPLVHNGYAKYPRAHARRRRRPLRALAHAHADDEAARHVRQLARAPACQDRGDRPSARVRGFDEPRPALGQREHRARHVHRQPGGREGAAARHQHQPPRRCLPRALRAEVAQPAVADHRRREGGRARCRAGVLVLAARAQHADGLVRARAAAVTGHGQLPDGARRAVVR